MNNKVLFCATVDYHFKAFHLPYLKWFKKQGWEVDVAASGTMHLPYTDNKFNIPIQRSPFRKQNISAYRQLKKLIDNNDYSIIHCHTPLGGVLTRLAARKAGKKGTKIIYTAHGFHFCKGVSIKNWLIYYPIERYLSRLTDSLITINQEDYKLAVRHQFPAKEIKYISGVGVDTDKFVPVDINIKEQLKLAEGYRKEDLLLFYAGEFNENKNQQFLIHSMVHILAANKNVKLLLAGNGGLEEECKQLAKQLGIDKQVVFLGFRKDIHQILSMCDVAVAASKREGLPVNIMEAMSCGLPVVAVDNRGHRELVQNNINGWLITNWATEEFASKVMTLFDVNLRKKFGVNGREIMMSQYSINQVLQEKSQIYSELMYEKEVVNWIAP